MRTILLAAIELALALCIGCTRPASGGGGVAVVSNRPAEIWIDEEKDGPQPMTEEEFADWIASIKQTNITPDPISTDILAPAPTPHASCRCKTCDCTPACVGACSIPQPAGTVPEPIATPFHTPSGVPATSGSDNSSCPGGQCSVRSAPVRRGIFGWRR